MKNFLKNILFFPIVFLPILTFAQGDIIVPNCSPNCGYNDLLQLVNNIINWIIMISIPIAAGVFAWAGFKYMTTGISDQKSAAKAMLQKVFIGFVFILSAWIIVNTITNALLSDENGFKQAVPVEGTKK
jgi:hypothetical protein